MTTPPKDFFGNLIKEGDRFFNGNPCAEGIVCSIHGKAIKIVIDNGGSVMDDDYMTLKSPDKGVCLDKIPLGGETQYKVAWRIWKGIEPCGQAEYSSYSQLFNDVALARECYANKEQHADRVTLTKIQTKLLRRCND